MGGFVVLLALGQSFPQILDVAPSDPELSKNVLVLPDLLVQLLLQLLHLGPELIVLLGVMEEGLLHGASKVVLDVPLGNLEAPFQGGPDVAVRAQGLDNGLDLLQGFALLVLRRCHIRGNELDVEDVGSRKTTSLESGLEGPLRYPIIRGGNGGGHHLIHPGGPIADLVCVHTIYLQIAFR